MCGYRSKIATYRSSLSSLSTLSSILLGFSAAGLIELLGVPSSRLRWWAVLVWIVAAVGLFTTLLASEFLAHKSYGRRLSSVLASAALEEYWDRECSRLIVLFLFSMLWMGSAIVMVGFLYSRLHGVVAAALTLAAFLYVLRVFFRNPLDE